MRVLSFLLLISALLSTPAVSGESSRQATLYKNPQCGCCETYADYLRANGFEVTTHDGGNSEAVLAAGSQSTHSIALPASFAPSLRV